MKKISTLTFILLALFSASSGANPCIATGDGSNIPDVRLEPIISNLEYPVHIANDRYHSDRIYVVEQDGLVQIVDLKKRKKFSRPFLDITNLVASGGEKGLLSIVFHPDYPKDKRFFVNYTTGEENLFTIVAEYTANDDLLTAKHNGRVLLKISQPFANHNGGQIDFGPDGYLYIGMGDGGSGNDPLGNGQNLKTLLGTILRIDVNRKSGGQPYGIPADNPFINKTTARPEIWAYGLRNPWRFSFDALTGELWTADVGQDDVEEINIIKKGGNYGWNIMEGNICTPHVNVSCNRNNLQLPVFTYGHDQGRSITGGAVYRGKAIQGLCGVYIFGDYVMQRIWGITLSNHKVIAQKELVSRGNLAQGLLSYVSGNSLFISSFGYDMSNELYVAAHRSGKIFKIVSGI